MEAIRPEDIKRLSNLEEAGIRGGIHSQHTWLVALHDGSLWIAKKTGTEERDEIFVYLLAQKMFRGIVPETVPGYIPKIGWVSMQRKVSGIPAGRVDGLHGYFHGNDEMQADLVAMVVLDYLVGNPDRHANNWFLMHNDRLAAIDNGWAGEENTLPLSAVFEPASLAGLVRDESLWPKMLQMMLTLITDLTGRGDEARAMAQEIAIDQKDAVDMVRLWEPKLQRLARFIQAEASKLKKEKVYVTQGEQPPLGVHIEEGPRGGHYYESEGIPIATDKPRGWGTEEDPEKVAEWAREHTAGDDDDEALPDFSAFGGDVDALFEYANTGAGTDELKEFFARAWTTEVTRADITRVTVTEDNIELSVELRDPETDAPIGNMLRTFSKGGEVHHDMFTINQSVQGQGIGLAVNRQAEEAYREMGFYGISLSADIRVGKYAWAQQGYDFVDDREQSTAWEKLIEFQWENGGYDRWAEDESDRVEDAHTEEWGEAETGEEREEADARRDAGMKEITDQANYPPDDFVEERREEQGFDAWELASLDDGQGYGADGWTLGKAFMLSDYMDEWHAYKDLDPESMHSSVGDVYWDKKKHKIAGKKKKAAAAREAEARKVPDEWKAENLDTMRTRLRDEVLTPLNDAVNNKVEPLRADNATPEMRRHANNLVRVYNHEAREVWARYNAWGRQKIIAAGYEPTGEFNTEEARTGSTSLPPPSQENRMVKAKERRIPVELPAGSRVREGVTDEGVWDIDEDTDAEWREEIRRLKMEQVTEALLRKEKVYIKPGEQPPEGVQVEEGPRGGRYYAGKPVFPGFERPQEHRAGAALLNDEAVVLSGQQSDIFIMALEGMLDTREFASISDPHMSDGPTRAAMKAHVSNAIAARLDEAEMALPPGLSAASYVSKMLSSWAASSSDDNDDSIAMQLAAAELFDVRSTPYIEEHPRADWFREHEIGQRELMRAKMVVQAMYDETQEFFKKHDIQELVLFRGMRWIDDMEPREVQDVAWRAPSDDNRELMPGLRTAEIAMHANPLSSWSYEPEEAESFANYKPDVEGTDYEGGGGYDFNDPVFLDQAVEAIKEEAKEAGVDIEDEHAYRKWQDEYLADKGYYDVGQWAYSYMDMEPPEIEVAATRALMVSKVPVRKILATAMTGLGCLSEGEIVTLGGDNFPTQIYAGRNPEGADMRMPNFRDIVVAERDYAETQTPEALEAERAKKEFSTWADANLSDLIQQRVHAVNQAKPSVKKIVPLSEKVRELQVQMHAEPTLGGYERVAASIRGLNRQREAIISQATHEAEEPFRVRAAQVIEEAGYEVPEGWKPRGILKKAKGRTYLKPGQQAPAGSQEQEGPRGGRYYEPEGRGAAVEETSEWRGGLLEKPLNDAIMDFVQTLDLDEYEAKALTDSAASDPFVRGKLKKHVAETLATQTGIDYYIVNEYLAAWSASSSDHNAKSIAMQVAASEMQGLRLPGGMLAIYEDVAGDEDELDELIDDETASIILKAIYENTQTWLRERGIDKLYLVRGMSFSTGDVWSTGEPLPDEMQPDELLEAGWNTGDDEELWEKRLEFRQNPLSSWSSNAPTALVFAIRSEDENEVGAMMFAEFDAASIISTPFTGIGCLEESEFIVAGGSLPVYARFISSPTSTSLETEKWLLGDQ